MRKTKKIAILLCCICLVASMTTLAPLAGGADAVGYTSARVGKASLADVENILSFDAEKSETSYKINSPQGLCKLSELVSEGISFSGITVLLACDLDMGEVTDFAPIGRDNTRAFSGTFDGCGHAIENLIILSTEKGSLLGGKRLVYVGLFGYLAGGATVKNLTVGKHCAVSYLGTADTPYLGGLAGAIRNTSNSHVTVDNCRIYAEIRGYTVAGGVIGAVDGTPVGEVNIIRNTTHDGLVSATGIAGGFCGIVTSKVEISNCRNMGSVYVNAKAGSETVNGGGFVAYPKASGAASLIGCINNADLYGPDYLGAFYGYVKYQNISIVECVNYGAVDAKYDFGGDRSGVNGMIEDNVELTIDGLYDCSGEEDETLDSVEAYTTDFSGEKEEQSKSTADDGSRTGCSSSTSGVAFCFLPMAIAFFAKKRRSLRKMLCLALLAAILCTGVSCTHGNDGEGTGTPTEADPQISEEGEETRPTDWVEPWKYTGSQITFNHDSPSATVLSDEILYRATGAFSYCAWGTTCRDENGVLYSVFSGDRLAHVCPYGKTMMAKSTDGGVTWTQARVINDSPCDDRDAGITYVGNGKLVVSYFCHAASTYYSGERTSILTAATDAGVYQTVFDHLKEMEENPDDYPGGCYVIISEDYGETWSEPISEPVSAPHGPIVASNGELLYAGKISYNTEYRDSQLALFRSPDQGKTWEAVSCIPTPYGMDASNVWELSIEELSNGNLIVAIRVEKAFVSLPYTIFTCTSEDGGRTWSEPVATGLNGSPPHLLELSDGSLLMTYSRRSAPCSIRAVLSFDGGKTWSSEMTIATAPNGDMGYPSTVELDDHTLVTTYYKISGSDEKTSIYCARWTLD